MGSERNQEVIANNQETDYPIPVTAGTRFVVKPDGEAIDGSDLFQGDLLDKRTKGERRLDAVEGIGNLVLLLVVILMIPAAVISYLTDW